MLFLILLSSEIVKAKYLNAKNVYVLKHLKGYTTCTTKRDLIKVNLKKCGHGMITNETTLHQGPIDIEVNNFPAINNEQNPYYILDYIKRPGRDQF